MEKRIKIRSDKICVVCRLHTVQIKKKQGWICKECHAVQPNKEEV